MKYFVLIGCVVLIAGCHHSKEVQCCEPIGPLGPRGCVLSYTPPECAGSDESCQKEFDAVIRKLCDDQLKGVTDAR